MLDLSKPMKTRHGYPARLIYDEHKHEYGPLVFAILHPEGIERIGFRGPEGRYPRSLSPVNDDEPSVWDIVNAPDPVNMVIVQVRNGIGIVTQVPHGIVVKVMDYDVHPEDEGLITDEEGKLCDVTFHGPCGLYHVWPFA